jgi:hypothetical protein
MEYNLDPGRYTVDAMVKLSARYELRVYTDWVGKMETECESQQAATDENGVSTFAGDQFQIEGIRKAICEGSYNNGAAALAAHDGGHASQGLFEACGVQWANIIDALLRQTAWLSTGAQDDSISGTAGMQSRRVKQSKVDGQLDYVANCQSGPTPIDEGMVPEVDMTDGDARLKRPGFIGPAAGVLADYDNEHLGSLVNNTNVSELLMKMRAHGCFLLAADGKFKANPVVVTGTTPSEGPDSGSKAMLLNMDDELVFPVDLKTVAGYGNSDIALHGSATVGCEINVTLKQSVQPEGEVDLDTAGNGHAGVSSTATGSITA